MKNTVVWIRSYGLSLLFTWVFFVGTAQAEDEHPAATSNRLEHASPEVLADAISENAVLFRTRAREAAEIKKKITSAWSNPSFTSETIEAKRKTLREAEAAMIQARIALQEEMNRLPEIKELTEKNEALLKEVDALQKHNTRLIARLRAARKAKAASDHSMRPSP